MLVRQVFPLKKNNACLIHAAAGGVGVLLTQWAKHIGARVIAVVGNEAKVAVAKENGADDVIIRTKTDSIAADVRSITGGLGVQVAYDSVGAATFEASLDSLAMRGHMVTFGNASGPVPAVAPLELSRRGSLTLTRPTLFHYATPDRLPAMAAALFEMVAKGALKPKISHRFNLADIADAHRLLESGESAGAIVVMP
jgi:NADPH2:quinone reductase